MPASNVARHSNGESQVRQLGIGMASYMARTFFSKRKKVMPRRIAPIWLMAMAVVTFSRL
jgi:hypothetical protein